MTERSGAPAATLVVDDHPPSQAWLLRAVRLAFPDTVAHAAGTLAEGRRLAAQVAPQLALIDLDLPDGSGIALIEQLARAVPRPLAVVATVFADDQHLFPALRAGAVGYVLKDGPVENLAVMLAGIGRGEMPLSARIAGRLVGWFHAPAAEANALLSPREQDLLPLLAKGLTIAQAAQALGIMPSTAASYAKTLYRKLDVTSRAEAALEAARRGLIKP